MSMTCLCCLLCSWYSWSEHLINSQYAMASELFIGCQSRFIVDDTFSYIVLLSIGWHCQWIFVSFNSMQQIHCRWYFFVDRSTFYRLHCQFIFGSFISIQQMRSLSRPSPPSASLWRSRDRQCQGLLIDCLHVASYKSMVLSP